MNKIKYVLARMVVLTAESILMLFLILLAIATLPFWLVTWAYDVAGN